MAENNVFLSVRDLTIWYETHEETVYAVNNVSFDLQKGHVLGLVGETGAGKTTIAKAIMGILPDPPAVVKGGSIELGEKNLLSLSEAEMRNVRGNQVTMIFQDPMTALNPVMPVGKQIAEVVHLHNEVGKEEAKKRAEEMLEMVGIPAARYGEYPHQFSGGMKQRVVIAIALACNPDLLLADEPTTALDVTIQAQVLELIHRLNKEKNSSMLLITHDLGVVAQMCDDVAVIYAGEIVEMGSKRDIFKNPSHPYTKGLFDALPRLDRDCEMLKPIMGLPPDPTNLPEGCKFHPRCPYATEACGHTRFELQEVTSGHLSRCGVIVNREGE